jgi:hypothetical protein
MEQIISFEQFLEKKKIEATTFMAKENELFERLKKDFQQSNEQSFVVQKKFFFNDLRRKYPIT